MNNWEAYCFEPRSTKEILNDSMVVVDTNVLLSAYQWRDITVKEVLNILSHLAENKRLFIPEHVVKEFSTNRPKEIILRLNDLENAISQLQKPTDLKQRVPMLEGQEIFEKTKDLQNKYIESLQEYKNGLIEIRDYLKELFYDDPILTKFKEIFRNSVYTPDGLLSEEELLKSASKRFKERIPPGYKDSPKEDNSAGDYIIWSNILRLNNNVIFISNEKKKDWVYTDKHKNIIGPRRELIEEFYIESKGKTFAFISPNEFISLIKPEVSSEVKDDLKHNQDFRFNYDYYMKPRHEKMVIENICDIIAEFDPIGLCDLTGNDEYIDEARSILDVLPYVNDKTQLAVEVRRIFVKAFDEKLVGPFDNYIEIAKKVMELKKSLEKYFES